MNSSKKLLLIGLPGSGKTSFLAALWFMVDGQWPTALTLDSLQGDREYLNLIRSKWLACQAIERTRPINEPMIVMHLRNSKSPSVAEINIPDLSGETFRNQWLKRMWSVEFQHLISDVQGALLFVHPDKIVQPWRIDQAEPLTSEVSTLIATQTPQPGSTSEIHEWDPGKAPTQVQLVELLQFIENSKDVIKPFKLAVVVSAWDRIAHLKLALTPSSWLMITLPLLHQYLTTNNSIIPHCVFGISAQGGQYPEDEDLIASKKPSERIIIINQDNIQGNDITAPLEWLMVPYE